MGISPHKQHRAAKTLAIKQQKLKQTIDTSLSCFFKSLRKSVLIESKDEVINGYILKILKKRAGYFKDNKNFYSKSILPNG